MKIRNYIVENTCTVATLLLLLLLNAAEIVNYSTENIEYVYEH